MFAQAQQQIQMKGFRPGKVPRDIVKKRFGASILAEAKEQMLNRFFGEACRNKDINRSVASRSTASSSSRSSRVRRCSSPPRSTCARPSS